MKKITKVLFIFLLLATLFTGCSSRVLRSAGRGAITGAAAGAAAGAVQALL
ncbi:hypothetical protein [Cetobacterium sp. SF1]|uniref:hypothetical protein n=1 Tax=unclassified Cetobacterium TaxID=2630983 RepID=UPI003CE84808